MTNPKHNLKKSNCPVCLTYGTTAGLTKHVAEKHQESAWPQWTELVTNNWRLGKDQPGLPTATVCAINDYQGCPPWWWAIHDDTSTVASGTTQSEQEAKEKAWTQWLRAVGNRKASARTGSERLAK